MKVTNGGDDDGSVGVGGVGEGGRCVGWREVVQEMEKEGEEEEELWHWEGNGGTCMGWIDRGCLNECAGSINRSIKRGPSFNFRGQKVNLSWS